MRMDRDTTKRRETINKVRMQNPSSRQKWPRRCCLSDSFDDTSELSSNPFLQNHYTSLLDEIYLDYHSHSYPYCRLNLGSLNCLASLHWHIAMLINIPLAPSVAPWVRKKSTGRSSPNNLPYTALCITFTTLVKEKLDDHRDDT